MHAAGFAAFFFYGVGAAKFQPRTAHGFGARQAGSDVLVDLLLKVEAKFIVEFHFDGVAPEQGAQPCAEIGKHGRGS